MLNPFKKIDPEVVVALKYKFPDELETRITPSVDGGFVVYVDNLPGCITQGETGQELFEMVNDAVYTYLEIPNEYRPYMPAFLPSEEFRKEFNIKIPNQKVILQRV